VADFLLVLIELSSALTVEALSGYCSKLWCSKGGGSLSANFGEVEVVHQRLLLSENRGGVGFLPISRYISETV